MMNYKEGSILFGLICFLIVMAGCEDVSNQPRTGKISGVSINKALLQENKALKQNQDMILKKYEQLRIKMQEMKDKHQAWIIFQNEVDVIINELAKLGAVIRGKDRIALEEELYFKKGSVALSKKGESVLSQIAQELRGVDFIIHVEGHTDTVPVRSARNRQLYKDNWGLSGARAAEVVRYLAGPGRIPPQRLVGVFYGEFRPVAKNTKRGNSKNRRVEIRLVPPYIEAEKSMTVSTTYKPLDVKTEPVIQENTGSFLNPIGTTKEKPISIKTVEKVKEEKEEPVGIVPKEEVKEEPIEKVEDKEEETPVIIR